jgi:antitoxin FitA
MQQVNLWAEARMTTITVSISDDRMQKLRERASHYHVAPEELVRVSLDDLLARSEEDLRQAVEYVLNKNTDLYQRLA